MRDDLPRTQIIRTKADLMKKVLDPAIECQSVIPINEESMLLNYRVKEGTRTTNKTTNVVIAAFTTCYDRLELYKYLDMLGPARFLCYHTVSIIFTYNEEQFAKNLTQIR